MSTFVTLQLNASTAAGDWATLPAGIARTGTGALGARTRRIDTTREERIIVQIAELRGVVEAITAGVDSANIAETRTRHTDVEFGAPALYHGMRFAFDVA